MDAPAVGSTERIIGYDAREYWVPVEQSWSEERKQGFLYRLDVLKPLSVDTLVWPTIFESEGRPEPWGRIGFQNCWADLLDLRHAATLAFQEKSMRAWRTVAITLLLDPYNQDEQELWSSRLPPVNPEQRGTDWVFLGYDVADQWMLSGLSNCGFRAGLDENRVKGGAVVHFTIQRPKTKNGA